MVFNNAGVFYPEETDPDVGGGPIRRSPLVTARSGDGTPPHGWPQMVQRTPHQAVYEPEPGGADYAWLARMKFLPDGRLVPAGALGDAFGAPSAAELAAKRLLLWGILGSAAAGMAIGAVTSSRRLRGAGIGLALGAGSGFVLSAVVGQAAVMGAELWKEKTPA
jgi:hypothetical protein